MAEGRRCCASAALAAAALMLPSAAGARTLTEPDLAISKMVAAGPSASRRNWGRAGLQRLELAVLNRDPSLDGRPANGAREHVTDRTSPGRGTHQRRLVVAVGSSVAAAIAVAAIVVVSSRGGAPHLSAVAANSVGAISPAAGTIAAQVPLGASPSRLAAAEDALWVANLDANTVSRIDVASRTVSQTLPVGSSPSAIAVGAGAVWVASALSGNLSRIDTKAGRVVQTIAVGNGPSGVAVGGGAVWVTNSSDATVSRVDAVTGSVVRTIPLGGGATDVAVGAGAVWVSDQRAGRVLRVDPQTNQVTASVSVGTGPGAIVVGDGSVWVANSLDGTVSRIDPQTNTVKETIAVGDGPDAIAVGAGGVWVANEFSDSVTRINPSNGAVASSTTVGNAPHGLALAGGLVWVGAQAAGSRHRGGTLTVLSRTSLGSFDPAQAYNAGGYTPLTNDGLTALQRAGGSDGAQLVPDLATSLPAPTNDGRTYTFQLRRGIRYSNGVLVRPEDFRRAIERDFRLGDANARAYYADLIGGVECEARPARCDLSHGIVANDAANTVAFHLVAPDPELLDRLAVWDAVAVAPGAPNHDVGSRPLPATGAYYAASVTPREVRFVRNPHFHEWSRAARPDGYPNQIIARFGTSPPTELTEVERGSADYTLDGPPPGRVNELETRFPSQLHINPDVVLDEIVLNTHTPPFTDVRVRRALNYAVDRGIVARLAGSEAQPSCQFLTPYIPGYKRYCPYTLHPSSGGAWRTPDMAKAQRLISASHTRGTPITIWNLGLSGNATAIGRYVVSLLDRLGYRARQRDLTSDPTAAGRFADSRTKAQLALIGYFPNYPAASEYIKWFLSCENFVPHSASNSNWPEFCDPHLESMIHRALAAQASTSPAAEATWAEADRHVTDQAVMVPLVIPSTIDFVSRRVGNYEYSPQHGVLPDQLWVR
jgi:YVTN family beta-propeller protein